MIVLDKISTSTEYTAIDNTIPEADLKSVTITVNTSSKSSVSDVN